LAGFAPAPAQIDRDQLMFRAGRAAAGGITVSPRASTAWMWPASSAALAAVSLSLAVALFIGPSSTPEIVYRDRPTANSSVMQTAALPQWDDAHRSPAGFHVPPDNYVRTREVALRMGLDAIGAPSGSGVISDSGATYGRLLSELDGKPREAAEGATWLDLLLNM